MIGRKSSVPSSIAGAAIGEGPYSIRILILGESWAAGKRLFPELPEAIAQRTCSSVAICAIAYAGQNTGKIARRFDRVQAVEALGDEPTNVIILTGVNDQVQRRGTRFYVDQLRCLTSLFPSAMVQVVSPPKVNLTPPIPLLFRAKNQAFGLWNREQSADYRTALYRAFPGCNVIDFDHFSSGFYAEPERYAADGIHLQLAEYHKYGSFLGERIHIGELPSVA